MRILLSSYRFEPSIGGTETATRLLAREYSRQNHEVRVVTTTQQERCIRKYEVIANPSHKTLVNLIRWCDVYHANHIWLRISWPLLFIRRPWIVTHQAWLPRGPLSRLIRRISLKYPFSVSISAAISTDIPVPSPVIHNPYDEEVFHEMKDAGRDRDLIFVGRLIRDKGVDLLLHSISDMKNKGIMPTCTIAGDGPEKRNLEDLAARLGISSQVLFEGPVTGGFLCELLNKHLILVVPSRWKEPFGIVALEGIASGCVAVGADGGGLGDAIGACGELFARGDPSSLTDVLTKLLSNRDSLSAYRMEAPAHLARHTSASIAREYLQLFDKLRA